MARQGRGRQREATRRERARLRRERSERAIRERGLAPRPVGNRRPGNGGASMPRRAKVVKREQLPDPRYQSVLVTRIVNKIMQRGKKGTAERILYGADRKEHTSELQSRQYLVC